MPPPPPPTCCSTGRAPADLPPNVEDPIVTTPGWYKVTAFTNNACEASINILVVAAPAVPQVGISGSSWNCTQINVPLQVSCNLPVESYEWTGPGNFTSQEASPLAPSPGVYFLTLTADNGCTAVASTTVGLDIAVPDVRALCRRYPDLRSACYDHYGKLLRARRRTELDGSKYEFPRRTGHSASR